MGGLYEIILDVEMTSTRKKNPSGWSVWLDTEGRGSHLDLL